MKTYYEKLKDPRWQKLRLEILNRDGWTCQICNDKESTLNVHHRYYLKGADPWEYPPKALVSLCESCHEEERVESPIQENLFVKILREKFFSFQINQFALAFRNSKKPEGIHEFMLAFTWAMLHDDMHNKIIEPYNEYFKE